MKRIVRSVLCMSLTALVSLTAFAQQTEHKKMNKEGWKEKVQAERVAYLTTAMELTVEESQAFWPVYNAVQKEKVNAFKDVAAAMDALKGAIQEGKTGKEVEVLLQSFLAAREDCEEIDKEAVAKYKKVLPVEKVAKLFVAEEQFRHQQIKRLNKDGKPDGQQMRDGNAERPQRGEGPQRSGRTGQNRNRTRQMQMDFNEQ